MWAYEDVIAYTASYTAQLHNITLENVLLQDGAYLQQQLLFNT